MGVPAEAVATFADQAAERVERDGADAPLEVPPIVRERA